MRFATTSILIALIWPGPASHAADDEVAALRRAFPGLQSTYHSGRSDGRGYGHQGITWGNGHWYLFGTDRLYRYETDDFTVDQAKLKVKNEDPFGHSDFHGTGIDHMGAPHYHDGKVYSFAKTANRTSPLEARMRLVWYDADDLSYTAGSFLDLEVPPGDDGNPQLVSGGPFIVGEFFYAALAHKTPDGKKLSCRQIGRFRLKDGKFVSAISVSKPYFGPQGIFVDPQGNFYVIETRGHLKKYAPDGDYLGTVFRGPLRAIYEGFYYDVKSNLLTISITKKGIHIARVRLNKKP